MGIERAIMLPHPPLAVPAVGRGEENKIPSTVKACREAAAFLAAAKPDTLVFLSPHATMYYDYFHIAPGAGAGGDFARFGANRPRFQARYDEGFVQSLCALCEAEGFPAGTLGERDRALDHGVLVPLYFLQSAFEAAGLALPSLVRIGLSGQPLRLHYRLGMLLGRTAETLGRRVCVVASGDLSHHLKEDGPYGYREEGPQYDARIMEAMGRGDFGALFGFSARFCEAAGECGHRAFTIMAGCFDGFAVRAERLSYEGPFGVGYGVCTFLRKGPDGARRFLEGETLRQYAAQRTRLEGEDDHVALARMAVEGYVLRGRRIALPENLSEALRTHRAGAFVSLHREDGALRGCIGTTEATKPSLAEEIIHNGISACSQDPRFPPVEAEELPFLRYSVDVLGPAEDIDSPDMLDVKRYGVIVSRGRKRGLLLPDLEGVDSVEAQIAIAREKAGIGADEAVRLQRFEVVRHH